ncbi:iron-containing redox enzyme family protein [Spirillospora sp. NPDC048911]|uniref:iron-containing redox enzyme family protein n=1 Tax=Spirillospora sp. NPDC048911 TaxID=3364527 RepID=UPI0037105123
MSLPTFTLPDLLTSLPLTTFEFSPEAAAEATALLDAGPEAIFHRLLRDQESEAMLLASRRVLHAFLPLPDGGEGLEEQSVDADGIAAEVRAVRAELEPTIKALTELEPALREAVARQRAPLGLVGGCWLDTLSQPATQPSVLVNRLFEQHFVLRGEGKAGRSVHRRRRRALEDAGIHLPALTAADFLDKAQARPLTALHANFYLALGRLPASFLPEVVGVHYAFHALGTDDLLNGLAPALPEDRLRDVLAEYLDLTCESPHGPAERARLLAAVRRVLDLEHEHVAMLGELAGWRAGLSLGARAAEIVARHAPYAGLLHRDIRVAGSPLTETFAAPDFDAADFLTRFRRTPHLKPRPGGGCRFLDAIKFGGPMFAIFDEHESAVLTAWVAEVHATGGGGGSAAGGGRWPVPEADLPPIELPVNRVGDVQARRWRTAVETSAPPDVIHAELPALDDREFLYRLVNIEHFPNTLARAKERAREGFADGDVLLIHGAAGRHTDASWFDYTPDALRARVETIYWDKLVNPYEPLAEIPDREQVVFHQKTMALGNLIEAAWAHRVGNTGHDRRRSDELMFAIYADEMGRGEVRKNHITLIHQVMESMSIGLPHVRDAAFKDQEELPDSHYFFAIGQLCLGLFPDSFYCEILGYNLAIEMYGLGELRMHEIEKLRAHGFDTAYEDAHLSIDNVSTGHTRQAVDVITTYLDEVERDHGAVAVQEEWRRIWRGYASFAFFTEHQLVASLRENAEAELVI